MNPPRVIEIGDLVLVPGHEPSDGVLSLKKYPLITYEKALLGQATGGKFPSVTFLERKKMSTKTSFKRIALVAASALAIAGFSAIPAHAAATATAETSSAGATIAGTVGTATTATNITVTTTGNAATSQVITVTAAVTTKPNGSAVAVGTAAGAGKLFLNATTPTTNTGWTSANGAAGVVTLTAGTAGGTNTAGAIDTAAALSLTADVAGTYTVTVSGSLTDTPVVITFNISQVAGAAGFVGTTAASLGADGPAGSTITSASAIAQTTLGIAQLALQSATADVKYNITVSGVGTLSKATAQHEFFNTAATTAGNTTAGDISFNNATNSTGGVIWTPTTVGKDFALLQIQSTVAGISTVTVTPISAAGAPGVTITATVTWGAAVGLSAGTSIVRIGAGVVADNQGATSTTTLNYTTTIDGTAISAAKTAVAGVIEVILLNSDGTAAQQQNTISATISGSGLILANESGTTTTAGTVRASSIANTTTNNVAWIHVSGDGSSGTGTVTVSVTNALTGTTTVLGTKTVTFTGSIASIAVASTNATIGAAGTTTGAAVATRLTALEALSVIDHTTVIAGAGGGTGTSTPAFVVKEMDSAGNPVTTAVPTISSSDTTVVASGTCIKDTTAAADVVTFGQGGANGFYNCSFTGASNAISGKSAILTIKTPSTTAGVNLTATITVTIGGTTPGTETITTDAASYAAGAAMVVTVTCKDTLGNPCADGVGSPKVSASKALGITSTALAAGFYAGGTNANATSVAKSALFSPSTAGDFLLTATSGNAAASAISASATVEADAGNGLALDAANAATDAANNAYDEAQNATQAASDALAAVTALSAQVSALIATVKSLAAMVAKIKAKVKA